MTVIGRVPPDMAAVGIDTLVERLFVERGASMLAINSTRCNRTQLDEHCPRDKRKHLPRPLTAGSRLEGASPLERWWTVGVS